ncbi:PaaI family thioesterase [Psychrobacillus glaciei]|uniref:PaaI family thioesterase n=1 Tax=Psychrobacillus glaciei TaxID=2283160 RepID=A0A5J6SL16_9BACI|nr:PaaI family thioesterase [Psychrobacillus glaciei]QFF98352.1 PaaI family thioesterase [Psychrobacillus glaciei]
MNELQSLLKQVTDNATDVEIRLVQEFLEGIQNKQKKDAPTYLNAIFHMNTQFEEDRCVVTLPVTPLSYNSFDMPHGGVIATLTDNAMGFLVNKDLRADGKGAVTTTMTIHYVKASTEKTLIATASYLHKGRQTLVMECTVTQLDGKKIAYATGSFFVITPPNPLK